MASLVLPHSLPLSYSLWLLFCPSSHPERARVHYLLPIYLYIFFLLVSFEDSFSRAQPAKVPNWNAKSRVNWEPDWRPKGATTKRQHSNKKENLFFFHIKKKQLRNEEEKSWSDGWRWEREKRAVIPCWILLRFLRPSFRLSFGKAERARVFSTLFL